VLGAGNIGQKVLRIAKGFGMHTIAYDVAPRGELAGEIGFEYVGFEELLRRSNVLVVNTARGGIIDPQALIDALRSGHLGGAVLHVLEAETSIGEEAEIVSSAYDVEMLKGIVRNHALLQIPNVIITPHAAFNSDEAVGRIIDTTVVNIHALLAGNPTNVVNAPGAPSQ